MRRVIRAATCAGLVIAAVGAAQASGLAASRPQPLIPRGGHVSGIARPESRGSGAAGLAPAATCTTPGGGNYATDCNTAGRPVDETWIATNGSTYAAGANDYNSYNGNADLGYYTSDDAKTWTDNGPLDLFPEGPNHVAGDPGLAVDALGVVYYSGIFLDYGDCNIGGVELARRDPRDGSWSYYEILANSDTAFQDKPAVAIDAKRVYVAWTRFGSCTGSGVTSPIRVAILPNGPASVPPTVTLKVPHSKYSQGASLAPDGTGGFWIAWEEFPSATATVGSIWLAHWRGPVLRWDQPIKVSPAGFTDLPSPLPGFAFRDNSFPVVALANGEPLVAWCSADTGQGRAYLWANGAEAMLSDAGDDQFFPALVVDVAGVPAVTWSQTDIANQTFDQYLSYNGRVSRVSTASSFPNQDTFFGGAFIGDYNGMAVSGTSVHPIWTDLRRPDPQFGGKAQDAFVYAP
jgi:hypothetical protein